MNKIERQIYWTKITFIYCRKSKSLIWFTNLFFKLEKHNNAHKIRKRLRNFTHNYDIFHIIFSKFR